MVPTSSRSGVPLKPTAGNTCRRTPVRSAAPGLRTKQERGEPGGHADGAPSQAAKPLPVEPGKTKSYGHVFAERFVVPFKLVAAWMNW